MYNKVRLKGGFLMRKKFEAGFKAKVALEAFRGEKTLSELSSEYGVHPNRIVRWKKELIAGAGGIFGAAVKKPDKSQQEQIDKLYRNIGELKVENGLKKNWIFWGKTAAGAH